MEKSKKQKDLRIVLLLIVFLLLSSLTFLISDIQSQRLTTVSKAAKSFTPVPSNLK